MPKKHLFPLFAASELMHIYIRYMLQTCMYRPRSFSVDDYCGCALSGTQVIFNCTMQIFNVMYMCIVYTRKVCNGHGLERARAAVTA